MKKLALTLFGAGVLAILAAGCRCCEHEERIAELEKQIAELQAKVAAAEPKSLWSADTYNYLAIGNSITWHSINNHWWNEVGMAASDAEHDYFHLVVQGLRERFGKVDARVVNFANWERTAHDRVQVLDDLVPLLDERVSLVTIQLGENVQDRRTLAADYEELIRFVQRRTGNRAKIIVIGAWGNREDAIRPAAAAKCGVAYASLAESYGKPEYRSKLGAIVRDAAGKAHRVDHAGVAWHPGDAGMALIARQVLAALDALPVSR